MAGMKNCPPGIHRSPGDELRPPDWWVVWLGPAGADGSVIIGRSKRLERHQYHRFFPETGEACRDVKGWVAGVEWMLGIHRGHQATSERGAGTESESVIR